MCGITTIISPDPSDHELLAAMTDTLRHRGPDNRGTFHDGLISLGHRRLSIIDLSPAGNQPMSNEDGSIRLVCNGEIYNYRDKMRELRERGHIFRSDCDCEVLIHLYEEYGTDLFEHVNGMYALVLWDSRKNRLIAAVDRFGKKPLYYSIAGQRIILGSEMKALLHFSWLSREVNIQAIDRYLALRYIPAPLTIYKSVSKLEPATMMVWQDGNVSFNRYWQPKPSGAAPSEDSESSRIDNFKEVLADAVALRLQSDVPLGIYLSGGVDSSAVSALMRRLVEGKKISYTLSLDYRYGEQARAQKIAEYLGYEYNPVTVTSGDFDLMPSVMYHLDEPFGDLLCLPAFLLARKAKEQLTVVLTGDGADEILTGYFHQKLMILRENYRFLLDRPAIGKILSRCLNHFPAALLNLFFDYPDRLGKREIQKLSQAASQCSSFGTFYDSITSCFTTVDRTAMYTEEVVKELIENEPLALEYQREINGNDGFSFLSRLSLLDLKYWIPFSVIYRLDKMNMAHAVETRSPFLDYRLVEHALNLPDRWKLNGNRNKAILRSLIERLYPPELREKGKQAFYIPITAQYKERYKAWVSGLLTPQSVTSRGLFRWSYIERLFNLFESGSMLATRQLTALAQLELWYRVFFDEGYRSFPGINHS